MSNRGVILKLLLGIFAALAALWGLKIRSAAIAEAGAREALVAVDPADVCRIEVSAPSYTGTLARASTSARWMLEMPGGMAAADGAAVMKILDALAFTPPGDSLSFDGMRDLCLAPADFGLSPPAFSIRLATYGGKKSGVSLGLKSPSEAEAYAMVEGFLSVFTVPVSVMAAIPGALDGFRPDRLLQFEPSLANAVDVRVPDAAFVKLIRSAGSWTVKSSDSAPALPSAVAALVNAVAEAKIRSYAATGFPIPLSRLTTYGIDPEKSMLVTVYGPGESSQVVFGNAVDDSVYALVQNGTAVVTVPAALKDACCVSAESFRDTRLFPVAASLVDSVTVSSPDGVCILRKEGDEWRLESPVVAPADQERVAEFVQRMLSLDSSATSAVPSGTVTVKIGGMSAALQPSLADAKALASLHDRTILALAASEIAKVTVTGEGVEGVSWPAVAGDSVPGAVTEALARLEAVSVVDLAASPEELEKLGLAKPYRTVAIDLKSSDSIRKNLLVGSALEDGSRYAMLSGAATVFTLSPSALAAFGI